MIFRSNIILVLVVDATIGLAGVLASLLVYCKSRNFRWCNIFGILQNRRFGGGKFSVKPVFQVSVLVLHVYSTGSTETFGAFYFR